jgi:hypothetical protein
LGVTAHRVEPGRGLSISARIVFWILGAILGSLGFAINKMGRSMTALRAREAVRADSRPPVLFLRSFDDDEMFLDGQDPLKADVWSLLGSSRLSLEELVAGAFSGFGPMVTIGRPGKNSPPPGAARFWVSDDWKEHVEELLEASQLVVMLLGDINAHAGLEWEVRRLFALDRPEKIVLIVPCINEDDIEGRWQSYRTLSGGRLPAYQGGEIVVRFSPSRDAFVTRVPRVYGTQYDRNWAAYMNALGASLRVDVEPTTTKPVPVKPKPVPFTPWVGICPACKEPSRMDAAFVIGKTHRCAHCGERVVMEKEWGT